MRLVFMSTFYLFNPISYCYLSWNIFKLNLKNPWFVKLFVDMLSESYIYKIDLTVKYFVLVQCTNECILFLLFFF